MIQYSKDEISNALQVIDSARINCQKMHLKFAEGTSQHTLLTNRIKALHIAKLLIEDEGENNHFAKNELLDALKPVASIISKCENGQRKHLVESTHYKRFQKMIDAMTIARVLIEAEISQKG